jgi:2-polyprenyl-6-methoxyphenol hydroxylase-like FAD-dependent oxidoreductase
MAKIGDHAVVLGASMAGLLAARTLADFFEQVTIVERDELPDRAENRRGVPQGRHLHGLLARGAQALEEMFPGVLDELVRDGARFLDGEDLSTLHYMLNGHLFTRTGAAPSFTAYASSRPFLEYHIRRRVSATPNVTLLENHDVANLASTPDHDRIIGVATADRRSRQVSILPADLVVDATGRGSRMPAWLDALGYKRPVEDHVVVHLTYSSQWLRMPAEALHEVIVLVGVRPGRPTGMGLLGCEDNTWLLTLMGMAGQEPPGTRAEMLDWAEELAPSHLVDALRAAEPIGDVTRHRVPCSQWRRYDKMRRFPAGLLVMGDAICSFNPIYAQGMTVAALEALALRDCLSDGTTELSRRFFRASVKPIRQAWQLAAGGDLALPEIDGAQSLTTRLFNLYVDRIMTAAEYDTVAVDRFSRVTALLDPATRLLRPAMLWRAAAANYRRPTDIPAAQTGPVAVNEFAVTK